MAENRLSHTKCRWCCLDALLEAADIVSLYRVIMRTILFRAWVVILSMESF